MLERIRRRSDGTWLAFCVCGLLSFAVWRVMNLPPTDAKPLPPPTLTQIEDHELSQGILHVFTTGDQMVLVYEGKEVAIAMMEVQP